LRLQVDTRKWLLARLAPHLLGDRLELSSDPDRPLIPPTELDTQKLALALCNVLHAAQKDGPEPIDATPVTLDAVPVAKYLPPLSLGEELDAARAAQRTRRPDAGSILSGPALRVVGDPK